MCGLYRGISMPPTAFLAIVWLVVIAYSSAAQTTNYVSKSGSHTSPFNTWEYAATNIQDAVDVASSGDTILVSNGVYSSGGVVVYGFTTNRVAVTKPVTVRSLNGPQVTVIQGVNIPRPNASSVRCVYLTNGASLIGFTLTNGGAGPYYKIDGRYRGGAGVWCESTNAMIYDCVIVGCSANFYDSFGEGNGGGTCYGTLSNCIISCNMAYAGGGAFGSVLNNCLLFSNTAQYQGGGTDSGVLNNCVLILNSTLHWGGGVCNSILNNCSVISNSSYLGGGVYKSVLNNCIVYNNIGNTGVNHLNSTARYCCTTPLPVGFGNITNDPAFLDSTTGNFRLSSNSPCINAGNNAYNRNGLDADGNPRIAGSTVDMGAYEFQTPTTVFPIYWLQQYNLPFDGSADASDSDGDGINNWQEWLADTCPTNASSSFRAQISSSNSITNFVAFSFTSSSNRLYTLVYQTNLAGGIWTNDTDQTDIFGTGGPQSLIITNSGAMGFYRIRARLP